MYTEFFGLSEQPFELTPNPRFLFLTRSHREVLASIIHGIRNRKGFISMTGEAGTGKTVLVHSLLGHLDQNVRTVLIFHTTITFTDLLKTILQELGLAGARENRMDLLQQLIQHLVQLRKRGETLLIIIDEAHRLPQKTLEELQMFCDLESRVVQVLFVGQPEFEDKLNSEDLKQLRRNIEIRRQIEGLSEEESNQYIDHRLRLCESSSSRMFTPKALSLICSYAQGIPRALNTVCDNALLMGSRSFIKKVDADIVRRVIRNMEGPGSQKRFPSPTTVVKKFHGFSLRLRFSPKKAFLILVISSLCLGILVLLTRKHTGQKSVKTWDIKSLESRSVYPESPPPSTSVQRVFPPSVPAANRQYKLKEIIAVKEGESISQLAQKYYGVVNVTLIDFLLEVNPEITNADLIIIDQKIKIPYVTEELLMIQSADRNYKIHAGTFETPDSARLYRDEPALKGKQIDLLPRKVSPGGTWYRVMVGKFENKDEALKTISLLRKKGLLPGFQGLRKME